MSEKTTCQKLLIKEGQTVLILNPPQGYLDSLSDLPPEVTILEKTGGMADIIQVFVTSLREVKEQLPSLKAILKPKGILWMTYPKGTSKVKTDLNRDILREYALTVGLEAVALFAVDETWSAMRLKVV
jgi:hypothetical protein